MSTHVSLKPSGTISSKILHDEDVPETPDKKDFNEILMFYFLLP